MQLGKWIKPSLVFIASIGAVWLAGQLPGMMSGGGLQAPAAPGAGDLIVGLVSAWPIYIALAICQALTFHYLKWFTTPIYLGGVFALALLMAWRYAGIMGPPAAG